MALSLASGLSLGQAGSSIEGQVRTINNQSLPSNVIVRLEAAEGAYLNQVLVGSDGKFVFHNLSSGIYRIVVTAEGYQTATQSVDMAWWASRTPTIYLVPAGKKTSPSAGPATVTASDLSAPRKAREEFEKGVRNLEQGKFQQARKHLEKAVAGHECYVRAYTALGLALGMAGQFKEADAALAKAIECDAGFAEAYVQQAVILNAQKKHRDCEAALQEAMGRFPNEWRIHYQLGIAKDGSGDYEGAERALLKAQSINPEVPAEFHLRIADVYLNTRKYQQAHAEMTKYLLADPNGEYAAPTRKIMKHLEVTGLASPAPAGVNPEKR
jgi:Flp pilus assembly protein TadD